MSDRCSRAGVPVLVFALAAMFANAAIADDETHNLKVFPEGTGKRELIGVMKGWAGALGVRCEFCHVQATPGDFQSFDFASDEKENKLTARRMYRMVQRLNDGEVRDASGKDDAKVSCITCHRGRTTTNTLDEAILEKIDADGIDAGVARYRELRDRYYGAGTYDFGPRSLLPAISSLAERQDGMADAIALAELTVQMHPEDADSRVVLAQFLMMNGDREAAVESLAKALELDPENHQASRLKKRLTP